ncbi:S1 family peptidase [Corynebacterium sp. TAE3-ERU12]|uniref:S1 family peptidase n=1 Tax=Corynebacterium sp. TAE3-ERU12 TaxID=2849491 RepID=UPI001C45B8A6|nr:S1 family peptidase [Corynebacterium sp. TAE3-ERU12]MBV7295366.1 S1 family peptidase [Corynebacterium sp. TAE3-ERU12]
MNQYPQYPNPAPGHGGNAGYGQYSQPGQYNHPGYHNQPGAQPYLAPSPPQMVPHGGGAGKKNTNSNLMVTLLGITGAVLICIAGLWAVLDSQQSSPLPVPAADYQVAAFGAGPGTEFFVAEKDSACTLGFAARDAEGQQGFITASHCGLVGDEVTVKDENGLLRPIGVFTISEANVDPASIKDRPYEPEEIFDLAFIRLYDQTLPIERTIAEIDAAPASVAVVDDIPPEQGTQLCFIGRTTGRSCGTVQGFTGWNGPSDVGFDASSQHGDSGAPVFWARPDGSLAAVGVLSLGTEDGTLSFAELLNSSDAQSLGLTVLLP